MSERRLFLSADECAAILAGRKTQFRRAVKLKPWQGIELRDDGQPWPWMDDGERGLDYWLPCPFGKPGDRLWVPEGFALSVIDPDGLTPEGGPENYHVIYRTDPPGGGWMDDDGNPVDPPWQFAFAMPRWAARIVLEVISVRVERLRDISTGDCVAEGCLGGIPGYGYSATPVEHYRHASNAIHGVGVWEANPWVWAVEFKRVDCRPASVG